jgi:hypothetical protein
LNCANLNLKFQIEISDSLASLGEANDGNAIRATGGNSGIPDGSAFIARVCRRRSKRAERGIIQSAPVSRAH